MKEGKEMKLNAEMIPTGTSTEDMRMRAILIRQFYREWKTDNPLQKRYNLSLKQDINIRMISIDETSAKASISYHSTLAVLQLDSILTYAKKVKVVKVKQGVKNQKNFREMIIMEHVCPGIGLVRMVVGVRHKTYDKVQYCITAIEA